MAKIIYKFKHTYCYIDGSRNNSMFIETFSYFERSEKVSDTEISQMWSELLQSNEKGVEKAPSSDNNFISLEMFEVSDPTPIEWIPNEPPIIGKEWKP